MNQPNQPAPKSAEEVLNEPTDELVAPLTYAARYVPDEEIDVMFPMELNNKELADYNFSQSTKREAAKEMRDKIFNNVKPE